MKHWQRAAICGVGLAWLAGCASTSVSPPSAEFEQRTEELGFNTVVFTDYSLNRRFESGLRGERNVIRITAERFGVERTETGTSEVWVMLRNHTDHHYVVEARTSFFTPGGAPTDAQPVWQRVYLPANAVTTYREKSVSTRPLQYRVEVREVQ